MNAPAPKRATRRFNDFPPAQQAGILCNDPGFQKFAAARSGLPGKAFHTSAAAEYLRNCCGIKSRSDLNTSRQAAEKLQTLRTEFDVWAGRQATPR